MRITFSSQVAWLCGLILMAVSADGVAESGGGTVVKDPAGVEVRLSLGKEHYFVGEEILATLTFVNEGGSPWEVLDGEYRAGGRPEDVVFEVRDEKGEAVAERPSWYFSRMFFDSGERSFPGKPVSFRKWSLTVPVNDWVRFERTGTYTLKVRTNRLRRGEAVGELVSNAVTVRIDPRTEAEEKEVLEKDGGILRAWRERGEKKPTVSRGNVDEATIRAGNRLGYLGTPAALSELMPLLAADDLTSPMAARALDGVPNPQEVAAQLLEAAKRADPPPGELVMGVYAALMTPGIPGWGLNIQTPNHSSALEVAVAKARAEMTEAMKTSGNRTAYASALWAGLQWQTQDTALRAEFTKYQLDLPPSQSGQLLYAWAGDLRVRPPDEGETGKNFQPGGEDLMPLVRQAAAAPMFNLDALVILARSHPEEAKRIIVRQVGRLAGLTENEADVVGYRLSDLGIQEIPELDDVFRAELKFPGERQDAVLPLIGQYGSVALLEEVEEFYEPRAGKLPCRTEAGLLKYLLRQNPAEGVKALERSLNARKKTRCYTILLTEVFRDYWEPSALPVVRAALNDTDAEAALSAAEVLQNHHAIETTDEMLAALERVKELTRNETDSAPAYRSGRIARWLLLRKDWTLSEAQRAQAAKLGQR